MHSKKFFQELTKGELPIFVRVFQALPKSKLDWRPHKKSKSARELVQSMSREAIALTKLFKTGVMDFNEDPKVTDAAGAVRVFKRELPKASAAAAKISDKDWMGRKVAMGEWKESIGMMGIHLFLDFIHHRGQLSTYIRPMGGKVPSIYGPSGDSK